MQIKIVQKISAIERENRFEFVGCAFLMCGTVTDELTCIERVRQRKIEGIMQGMKDFKNATFLVDEGARSTQRSYVRGF